MGMRENDGTPCRIDASRDTPLDPLPVHDGHDWTNVLDGRMRLLLGDDDLVIEPGEAVEVATLTPHWLGTRSGAVGRSCGAGATDGSASPRFVAVAFVRVVSWEQPLGGGLPGA